MSQESLIADIAKSFISGNTSDVVDVVTFVEAPWGLGIKLLPSQKFILKCLYGMPLDNTERIIPVPDMTNEHLLYTFTEREFLTWLYEEGRCNTDVTEGKIFQELILSIGRRGTKSSLAAFISNYELYKLVRRGDPAKYYGFQPGARIFILNVAPTDDQALIVFDMIQTQMSSCPYIRDRSVHKTLTYFDLQTDADLKVQGLRKRASLQSLAGGCSSNSLRGRNAIVVIMDEMAFFQDGAGRFSGKEVYNALKPSIASFNRDGKMIVISSPYAKYGAFYEAWHHATNEPDITLAFKMYSAMANPTLKPEYLRAAKRRNRTSFMCEFGAEFSDTITAWVDDEAEFKRCIVRESVPGRGVSDTKYFMGIDLGFKNDGAAIAIVHRDQKSGKIALDHADVWFSGSSDVWEMEDSIYKNCRKYAHLELLKMELIIAEIKELVRWFPLKAGLFDQSNGYALAELLTKEQLKQIEMENFTDRRNSEVYELVKRLYAEQLLELYNHPVLIPELLTLEAEKKSKGIISVEAPNRRGAHDDISEAYVRAVWSCYSSFKQRAPCLSTGAGGTVGSISVLSNAPQDVGSKQQTQASFMLQRRKMHGTYERETSRMRRRLPGAVM